MHTSATATAAAAACCSNSLCLLFASQDGRVLVGQEVLDPPEGYATPYSSSQSQRDAAVVIPLTDTFHSFKRLMGKRCGRAVWDG